jgi:SEC-C motif
VDRFYHRADRRCGSRRVARNLRDQGLILVPSRDDDFPKQVKETLAKRVGTLCSNPQCSVPTYGPGAQPTEGVSKGAAAHIRAASPGGPRYDPNMSATDRKGIGNGIWLCRNCADLVDADHARFAVEILERWKQVAEERARKALEAPRIVNAGADFADTILLVTTHKTYPALPQSALRGPRRRRKITCHPLRAHRTLLDLRVPVVAGPPPGPPGFGTILLSCQNQGAGVEQFVKFGLSFDGQPAIHRTEITNDRVKLSEGGLPGASMVTFMVREILPGEVMKASVIARNDLPFDAHLWTQQSGESPEVFVYDVIIGEEELVQSPRTHPVATPTQKTGRNELCPCGSGKKFKRCHGGNA